MADDEMTTSDSQDENTQDENKIECTIDVQDTGDWKKTISIEVPRSEIDKELDKQYGQFIRTNPVPGFRKGRAPRRLVEKRFGEDVSSQTKLKLLAQALEQAEEEQDFEVLGEPDFDPEKIEMPAEGNMTFEYEIEVKPQFDLPHLEGISIEKSVLEVTPQQVDDAVNELQMRRGTFIEVDKGAKDSDLITAKLVMTVAGVDEPQTTEDARIRVGSTAVMGAVAEDMPKALTGAKVDQTKTCSAKVSETHPNEDYRDKDAELTITIKDVRRHIPAELTAEFFTTLGVSDEKELRTQLEEDLENKLDRQQRDMMRQQVYEYLDKSVKFELPKGIAARYADRVLQRRYYELLNQGVSEEMLQENIEQLKASTSEQAAQELKTSFIMESVADKLDIVISQGEINGFIARVAAAYGRRPEKVREEMQRQGRLDTLGDQLRDEKAIDRLLEMAKVVDAPVPATETKTKTETKKPKKANKDEKAKKDQKPKKDQEAAEPDEKPASQKSTEKKDAKKPARKQVKRKPPSSDS